MFAKSWAGFVLSQKCALIGSQPEPGDSGAESRLPLVTDSIVPNLATPLPNRSESGTLSPPFIFFSLRIHLR